MGASSMSQIRRSDYLSMRLDFEPTSESIRLVIVAESPPASSKYFYNTNGKVSEPLFKALMKQLCIRAPNTKADGLREFQKRGWVLVDATYQPVNKLSSGGLRWITVTDYGDTWTDYGGLRADYGDTCIIRITRITGDYGGITGWDYGWDYGGGITGDYGDTCIIHHFVRHPTPKLGRQV
jgi:hypothetical protein